MVKDETGFEFSGSFVACEELFYVLQSADIIQKLLITGAMRVAIKLSTKQEEIGVC